MRISGLFHVMVVLAIALLAAGCGGGDDGSSKSSGSRTVVSTQPIDDERAGADAASADLQVVLTNVGDKSAGAGVPLPTGIPCDRSTPATCRGTLECPATDKRDEGVCAWLASAGAKLFASAPANEMCTEVYGGPEVAKVTGTFDGRKVDATFSRTNGCEIARFDAAAPLWTREVPAGADTGGGTQPPAASAMCVAEDPSRPVSRDNPAVPCEDMVVEPQPDIIIDPPEAFE